jgi:uncharacterized protein (TIGR02421 family)
MRGVHPTKAGRPEHSIAGTIGTLSHRLVAAQRPLNVLRALRWNRRTEESFFARGCQELPDITPAYYCNRALGFDVDAKLNEFARLEREIHSRLGSNDGAGHIMQRICRESALMVRLLSVRGSPDFATFSRQLYGTASAVIGKLSARQWPESSHEPVHQSDRGSGAFGATEAARLLALRLARYFNDRGAVRIAIDDRLQADAAAANGCIRLKANARFTPLDMDTLEVHEGWVHVATTLNAGMQQSCTFLTKPTASATVTQEGLAVVAESLAGVLHAGRARRLLGRVHAIHMAEHGADFLDVYRFFLEQRHAPRESYRQAVRVFRGSLPRGIGPFTKDLSYVRGFLDVAGLIRMELLAGRMHRIPLLFAGKTSALDLDHLSLLADRDLITRPRFVPRQFRDVRLLSAWSQISPAAFTMAA